MEMERVEASQRGWPAAPFQTKRETDANYKRCLEWLLQPERMAGVRLGLASHNLFDVAWGHLLATERGVADRVQFEMLQGMAQAQSAAVRETTGDEPPMLLYTPAVRDDDFDVAIGYLFRRLEENGRDALYLGRRELAYIEGMALDDGLGAEASYDSLEVEAIKATETEELGS